MKSREKKTAVVTNILKDVDWYNLCLTLYCMSVPTIYPCIVQDMVSQLACI